MSNLPNTVSHSAPKICAFCSKSKLKNIKITVSQGCSPSSYAISNIPLEVSALKQENIFFDKSYSILDLQMLGEDSPVDSYDFINHEKTLKKSKSASEDLDLYSFPVQNSESRKTKTIFFNYPVSIDEIDEDDKISTPSLSDIIPNDFPCIKLQDPPKNRHRRRKERCTFNNETLSEQRIKGVLKNYKLKRRYGFIKTENSTIFLCEDDLILSGVHLKKFKDSVSRKIPIYLEFNLKTILENGKEVQRAANIQINFGNDSSVSNI
ncbi:hypothetical protein SteCoe_3637 [Stentor coeruleus]|uniref:Uncharacterized protein n=1 Tax=Stentor coeruleus TaxID=5963 RepID=A0A1R2CWL9_9CILI|nr:hypothetical protein SteCoe_3637 [Stentor coeruleus]